MAVRRWRIIKMSRVWRTFLALSAATSLAVASFLPASANSVNLSALCGSGTGTTQIAGAETYGETEGSCYAKYLWCTYVVVGVPFNCGEGWTAYDQQDYFTSSASYVNGSHRLCNDTFTICSLWGFTAD
jgi:uncharacterized protein YraI